MAKEQISETAPQADSTNAHVAGTMHRGHRDRLKTQFVKHGLDSLADVNVLELILFYAIPRQDTNPIAHRLLDAFGSLSAVLDADIEDLVQRGGLSRNTATLLKLFPAVSRRLRISRHENGTVLDTTEKCAERLIPFFSDETQECAYLLCLDAKCCELGCIRLSTGSVGITELSIRRTVETALQQRAASVVLAHNHTSGVALPSGDDLSMTHTLSETLSSLGIYLADHIVVAGDRYVSMAESRLL